VDDYHSRQGIDLRTVECGLRPYPNYDPNFQESARQSLSVPASS
jgi:hypothetical protein